MRRNVLLWVVALVAAAALWLQQTLVGTRQLDITIPVSFSGLADSLNATQLNPDSIRVSVKGRGLDLVRWQMEDPQAVFLTENLKLGKNELYFGPDNLPTAAALGLTITRWEPRRFYLTLENHNRQRQEIKLRFADTAAARKYKERGYFMVDEYVYLDGTPSAGMRQEVYTAPISVAGLGADSLLVLLNCNDPGVRLEKPAVMLRRLSTELQTRWFIDLPVDPQRDDIEIIPASVAVLVSGPRQVLESLDAAQVPVVLDWDKKSSTANVRALMPDKRLTADKITPPQVRVYKK